MDDDELDAVAGGAFWQGELAPDGHEYGCFLTYHAETLVFVTPIYYYEMSGQMKTLLDRMNPLYTTDYSFRNVYMLSVAAEDEASTPVKAISGLEGWVNCFERAELADSLFCGGINDAGEAAGRTEAQQKAYEFGISLQ